MVLLILLENNWISILVFGAGWAILLSSVFGVIWGQLAWTLPMVVLILDLFEFLRFTKIGNNLTKIMVVKDYGYHSGEDNIMNKS